MRVYICQLKLIVTPLGIEKNNKKGIVIMFGNFSDKIKTIVTSTLPAIWSAPPADAHAVGKVPFVDVEKAQSLLNDEFSVFPMRQVHAALLRTNESSELQLQYFYLGESRVLKLDDEAALDLALEQIDDIDQWVIRQENGATLYKYRNKFEEIKTATSESELDMQVARAIPSGCNAWVIKDVAQRDEKNTYVMKQYNWFWSVSGVKRYSESESSVFLQDFMGVERSWDKSKLLLSTGVTAAVVGAGGGTSDRR